MRMVRLLITLAMIVTMLLAQAKSSQKLYQGLADEMDLKSLTAACKDGADFCEDSVGYRLQMISGVQEKKRAKRDLWRQLP